MEPDLDKQEVLRPNQTELSGDRLLNTHYVNTGTSSARRRKVSVTLTPSLVRDGALGWGVVYSKVKFKVVCQACVH